MSKKQKREKIVEIKQIIEDAGFVQDTWGNYKSPKNTSRILLKKVNIRFERKYSFGWCKIFSLPIITISLDKIIDTIVYVLSDEKKI